MEIKKILKEAGIQIGAGGSAGFVEVCIMHPLDLIKTRLQIQSGKPTGKVSDPNRYSGIFDCIRKMYKYEGLTSFWKGIIPPILAETPKRAVKVNQRFLHLSSIKNCFYLIHPHPHL
uniref:Mitochondrial 2-oxodicarboxylate carrier n=1 Tax=Photinus pyralis TaxID=7054 RepID=A0A1Y1JV98_PHOPY